ncbi:MAG: UDP-N-acetylmuramoyl-L-alanyl-D-glutamate--2,6-diaminopimelate ligase [Bacteroidetes bacterium]|nr:UDP-N-acetylmuramoyl-L-alanyl-D-glutamate--2,6-diaminopimelate ligase [Bacteroidota bacterium]MCH8525082.1 UDP-N-acetylmuramoyl-L-alanyl-D-glutamate--2,6-diaminopimelate ligase [Balneolales bacterium]
MLTLQQIIDIVKPSMIAGSSCIPNGKLTDDSREVKPGDIFVAVRGNAFDGHKFIPQAIEMGAAVIITEELTEAEGVCILLVQDTRLVMGPLALAMAGNPQKDLHIIGITGTNGKTTVATLIYQVLTRLQTKTALLGTVSKIFGTERVHSTLTTPGAVELAADLRRAADTGCTHFVMEVSSHALDQRRTQGLDFEVGVFTNLSHDHLDYHKTIEAYQQAKKHLFDSLSEKATAIVNIDDLSGHRMVSDTKARIWELTLRDDDYKVAAMDADGLLIDMDGIYIQSPLTGNFNAYNVAQAFLTCVALGYSPKNVVAALAECYGAAGRLENITLQLTDGHKQGQPAVFVDYAHTPDALENVLQTLQEIRKKNQSIHTVFGCGGNRDKTKRPAMAKIAARYSNIITVTSDNPRFEDPDEIINEICTGFTDETAYQRITQRDQAIRHVVGSGDENSIILIAGKGHEDYQEINGKRHPMNDRAIALDALRNRKSSPANKEIA